MGTDWPSRTGRQERNPSKLQRASKKSCSPPLYDQTLASPTAPPLKNRARGGLHRLHQSLGELCESPPNRSRRGRCAHFLLPVQDHCQHRHVRHRRHINGRALKILQNSVISNGKSHQNDDNVPRKIPGRRTNGGQ